MRAAGYIHGASRPKGGTPLPRQVYDWCLSSVAEVGGALNRQGLLVKCQQPTPFQDSGLRSSRTSDSNASLSLSPVQATYRRISS
jgi:hypothetical protein